MLRWLCCAATLYRSYAAGTTAKICEDTLCNEITGIRDNIKNDHKQHGALRFFGKLQPVSRLVTAIDETFKTAIVQQYLAEYGENINPYIKNRLIRKFSVSMSGGH